MYIVNLEEKVLFQNKHWGEGSFKTFEYRRDLYKNIWKDIDTNLIQLITGPRRVGKSVILKQIINSLIKEKFINPRQILFFEFSPKSNVDLIWKVFNYFQKEITNSHLPVYIFFDEVQYVEGYESEIKEIYDNSKNCKFILTGSLSLSYKKKMDDSLGGRFFSYKLYPLKFSEYLKLSNKDTFEIFEKTKKEKDNFKKQSNLEILNVEFRKFLEFHRFPETVEFSDQQIKAYIQNIITQSLNQDAFSYFDIQKPRIINALFEYFQINNGLTVSVNNLSKELQTSNQTITLYIDILEQMGLVYIVYNSSNPLIKTKASKKIYLNSSLALLNNKHDIQTAMGFAVESYVLERLLEKGEMVTFWRKRQREIDFLLPKEKIGYEVKFRINPRETQVKLEKYQIKTISLNQKNPACLF